MGYLSISYSLIIL